MISFRKTIRPIVRSALIGGIIFLGISFGLTFSQDLIPAADLDGLSGGKGLSFSSVGGANPLAERQSFKARDGSALDYREYVSAAAPEKILILVHGSGWHSGQFGSMASAIAKSGAATVITPDLRGHGYAPARRGDVDYIGQFEDDLADLIGVVSQRYPNQSIILGGHSSGGGLVIRFAGTPYGAKASAYLLMAPYLKYNAPTSRENSGGWARPLTRRIIGLSMLNSVGFTALNDLPVIQFNMPEKIRNGPLGHTATLIYSHRLNTSFAPRSDFEADLRAMTQPFLLIAGSEDEAFYANKYKDVIAAQTPSGLYQIMPGLSHLEIVQDEASIQKVADWIEQL